jgi:hypothetical protein
MLQVLCKEIGNFHNYVLCHTLRHAEIRCHSLGEILALLFELRAEILAALSRNTSA